MKKLLIAGAVVLVVLVGAVAFLASNLDSIVEKAIETIGPEMTGVSVKVKKVSLALTDGRGEIGGLVVGNPKGYKAPHAFSLGSIVLAIDPASVTKNVILIRELIIEAPDMAYEKGAGGSNVEVIQRNVEAYVKANFGGGAAQDKGKKADPAQETRFIVEKLQIRNGKVKVAGVIGKDADVALPAVNLRDVGKSKGGVTGGELAGIVVKQMTDGVVASVVRGAAKEAVGRVKEGVADRLPGKLLGR
jgi:hypothetical protein